MRVLIIDDEDGVRESLKELLEDEGFAVETAANGAEALATLQAGDPPCVVILDLIMPVMSGNELFARMQTDPRLSQVPVIISTSDPSRAPRGVPILQKPLNLDRLLGTLRQHCPVPQH